MREVEPTFPREAERRQITVVLCDLVNSTQLASELDPEDLNELLSAYSAAGCAAVKRFDGWPVAEQFQGDQLMAYFGWPRAHEDDAERAVRAALEIARAVKRVKSTRPLDVRIGVATGTVVVGGEGVHGFQLAKGVAPNLAARLQDLAQPGEVVIANDTRRLTCAAFDLFDLGTHQLKGITAPVRAWRVLGSSKVVSRFEASRNGPLTPFVGRDQELQELLRRQQLAHSGTGQVVLLAGEAGMGKSRLCNELLAQMVAQGVRALRFQCSPYHVNDPFWPSIDNFKCALKFVGDEDSETRLDKLEQLVVDEYGLQRDDVKFIASMLCIPCERYTPFPATAEACKKETFRTLMELTAAVARKHASMVLVEDLHWVDATTLEGLHEVIDKIKELPLLMVLTYRPEEFRNPWASRDHVATLNLNRLTFADTLAMLSAIDPRKVIPREQRDEIVSRTDGIPLFVEELTRFFLDQIRPHADHRHLELSPGEPHQIAETELPSKSTRREQLTVNAV